jgi:hypothetical protein
MVTFMDMLQVRYVVLIVMTVKIIVFWDVMACPSEGEG